MGLIQRRGGNSKDCLCDALENDGISVYHFSLPAILILHMTSEKIDMKGSGFYSFSIACYIYTLALRRLKLL